MLLLCKSCFVSLELHLKLIVWDVESFVFLRLTLVLDVSSDGVLISVHSNCRQVVSIRPELSFPDDGDDFWMNFENCFGCNTFDGLNNVWRRKSWNGLNEKMNMITFHSDFMKNVVIGFFEIYTTSRQCFLYFFCQYFSSEFSYQYNVVQNESERVRSGNVFNRKAWWICFHAAMILKGMKNGRSGLPPSRAEGNFLD